MPGAQIYVDIITSYPKVKAIIVISIPKTASNLRRPAIDIKNNIKEVNWWKKEVCIFCIENKNCDNVSTSVLVNMPA